MATNFLCLCVWTCATLVASALTGCSTIHRSQASGYESTSSASPVFRRDEKDLKPNQSTTEVSANRSALSKLEAMLIGNRERDQYFKNKPYMRSDTDRLEFLSLESYQDRNKWLTAHGVFGADTPNRPEIQAVIDANDITTGMTKQAVKDSWGEPELIEVAGNPLYGNERWAFSEQLPSSDGFQTEKRIVYFEGGRVVGWERH